ncbi:MULTISPECIES: bifunctional alpha/beta hydrolase/OsmC family protein [Sphingomonadaceae]|uniref:Redox protein n=1 Tax=Novosphingobium panipatense TaxID=428991 RepID=A0ABY1QXT4_9SPHN|nr:MULTISPECIES: bifunctional alpha/beta hydrolase/OsmC family protein [Sphingomonadaceae]SMP80818.1 putative redox protein [Novosphingobium panipatense]
MAQQMFDFEGASGRRLSGRLESPQATPRGWAIFAHCFTCGKDSLAAVRISRALARAGIGVLRFDFAGLGGSGGETFAADIDDLIAAADAMTAAGKSPSLLIGHSLGGAAALAAASELASIEAVATIGAPADIGHVLSHFDPGELARIDAEGVGEIELAGRHFLLRRSFIDDIRQQDLLSYVRDLKRPLLVLHAPSDPIVGIDNASEIFQHAKHPKSFVSLDTADHLLTNRTDAEYAAAVIAAWASRYLPPLEEDLPDLSRGDGVTALETGNGKFQLAMQAGPHHFLADEPVSVGGLASGLSPYELVSAGLAACTVMTMRMYAERKGLPLDRAGITVRYSKRPEDSPADFFERIITLEGPLDAAQRDKLMSIADRCPVDLTLVRGSEISTRLAE